MVRDETAPGPNPDPDILDAVLIARSNIRVFYRGPEAENRTGLG
jgi:hypothetical protein